MYHSTTARGWTNWTVTALSPCFFRMAALFLKRLTLQTLKKTAGNCTRRCFGTYILPLTIPARLPLVAPVPRLSSLMHARASGTVADTQDSRKKKTKNDPAFSNIGRKIHERVIHVLDEAGNDLGSMHRAEVIRLMAERDLRLVKRDSGSEPPRYQLLSGLQIHEERLRLREMEKAHPKPGRCRASCSPTPWDPTSAADHGLGQRALGL